MAKEREVNTVNYSPLRYPGGKSRLAPFISLLIQKSKIETPIYVEPFAGGGRCCVIFATQLCRS